MSERRWIKLESREPPVSTEHARFWLQIWIPARVQGESEAAKRMGLAMALYLGKGQFRIVGQENNTIETVTAWRHLSGSAVPCTERPPLYKASTNQEHRI